MRRKHCIVNTALSLGLSAMMMVGGIPAQALAEAADGQEQLSNQETLEPTEGALADDAAGGVNQEQGQDPVQEAEGENAAEQAEVKAQGDASPEEVAGQPKTLTFDSVQRDEDNNKLFEEYALQQFENALPQQEQDELVTAQGAEEGLNAHGLKIYERVAPMLKEVAAGTRTSTEFSLNMSDLDIDLSWTAGELGFASFESTSMENIVDAATDEALEAIGWGDLAWAWEYNAADLYWMSHEGVEWTPSFTLSYKGGQSVLKFVGLQLGFLVNKNYSSTGQEGTTNVNPSAATSVQNALSRAQDIVDQNKNQSTYYQMLAYKNAICNLTSLNSSAYSSALNEQYPNGYDPWQIIWVFDGNASTNVTYMGYAKAFQYLCDLSNFPDTECMCVTGTQYVQDFDGNGSAITSRQGKDLAWNVVRVEDGRSYLVDVANCDSGMDGNPNLLFIEPPSSGSYATGYVFSKSLGSNGNTRRITYVYGSEAKQLYGENVLTLATSPYAEFIDQRFVNYEPVMDGEDFYHFTYDGNPHTVEFANRDYVLTGTTTATDVGVYTVWARPKVGYAWNDASVMPKELKWTIRQKAVTITPNNKTKQMGAADPTFDVTVTGLASGDTADCLSCFFDRTAGELPGTYTIYANGSADQGNYSVTYGTGTLTITAASSNAVAASGIWGTCPWKLYGDGRLVIESGTGANTVGDESPWADYADLITSVSIGAKAGDRVVAPANCSYLFRDLQKMTSFDGSCLDCSNVTSMKGMFKTCSSLRNITGISTWNTASVQDMTSVFDGCLSIGTLDLSGWDTCSVTSYKSMFTSCYPKMFAIGEKYRLNMWVSEYEVVQTIPYAYIAPDPEYWSLGYSTEWWSTKDGKYYGAKAIMSDRMGIADIYTFEKPSSGWVKLSGAWYYYDANGAWHKGWLKDGGKWYYLDPATGKMKTGWLKSGSTWYYLASSGAMATGWAKVGSEWYYFASSGAMKTGWLKSGSTWYYLKSSGAMAVGWAKIGSTWYYFSASGAMKTGWIKLGSTWYYLNSSGAMVTGRQNIDGKWYTFSSSGAWVA